MLPRDWLIAGVTVTGLAAGVILTVLPMESAEAPSRQSATIASSSPSRGAAAATGHSSVASAPAAGTGEVNPTTVTSSARPTASSARAALHRKRANADAGSQHSAGDTRP